MLASRRSKEYSISSLRAVSSAGQSRGLLIPRSRVRIPDGAPVRLSNARDAPRIPGVFRFWATGGTSKGTRTPQAPMSLRLAAHPPPRRPSQGATQPRIPVLPGIRLPETPKVCALAKTAPTAKKSRPIYLQKYCQQKDRNGSLHVEKKLKRILLAIFVIGMSQTRGSQ